MPPASVAKRNSKSTSAVCPFCALLCDDLVLTQNADLSLRVRRNGCRRAAADFARLPALGPARVRGRAVALDDAISAAARLLKAARQPLFAGLATDVDGMRALINLAEMRGAIVDHVHGDALTAMSRVLQTRGWYATTLSEVRNRADLVIVVDVDLNVRYENFPRRCLKPQARLRPGHKQPRKVAFVGQRAHLAAELAPDHTLFCRADGISDTLSAVLAGLRGHRLDARRPGGLTAAAIKTLVDEIRAAEYCAMVFAPGSLGPQREPLIAAICDIVDEINRDSRAAVLALGGDDGGQSAVATGAWLTGYPLRTTFGKTLRYEPQINSTKNLLASAAVDAVLWIDAYGGHSAPPPGELDKTIVLAAREAPERDRYGVFIPVGTPGVDHAARLMRTDTVVTLPLKQQRDSGLPSVADVITRIMATP